MRTPVLGKQASFSEVQQQYIERLSVGITPSYMMRKRVYELIRRCKDA